MTFSEFSTLVKTQLTVDAVRHGLGDYVDAVIKNGIDDLLSYVEYYRRDHISRFDENNTVKDGKTSVLTLPDDAFIREIYYVNNQDGCKRKPMNSYPYSNRDDLVCGRVDGRRAYYSTDPYGTSVWVYPQIQPATDSTGAVSPCGTHVELRWDGKKQDYLDADPVPFDVPFAEAVALYAHMRIEREVKNDVTKAQDYERSYRLARGRLHWETKERLQEQTMASDAPGDPCDCPSIPGSCPPPPAADPPPCADAICGVESEGPGRYYGTGPGATDGAGFWALPIPPVVPPSPTFLSLPDVQPADYSGNRGKMVVVNNTEDFLIFRDVPTGGGASNFTDLIDAPDDYSGAKGKLVAVNSTDDGLEFVNPPGATIPDFTELTGTPSAYDAGKILVSTGTDLVWADPAGLRAIKLTMPGIGTGESKVTFTETGLVHPVVLTVLMRVHKVVAGDIFAVSGVRAGDVFDASLFMVYENGLAAGEWGHAFVWGVRKSAAGWAIFFKRWMPPHNTASNFGVSLPPIDTTLPEVNGVILHSVVHNNCEFFAIVRDMPLPAL